MFALDFITPKLLLIFALCCGLVLLAVFLFALLFRPSPPELPPAVVFPEETRIVVPEQVSGTPFFAPQMTHEASESRRLRDEHAALLTSIPPTPTPGSDDPELLEQAEALDLVALSNSGGGIPIEPDELDNWHDPERGLHFYREERGDWTSVLLRDSHPYRELLYYEFYPAGVVNFHDGSMLPVIGSMLSDEASKLLPDLGSPTSAINQVFSSRLGWELVSPEEPVIAVWTRFDFSSDGLLYEYAIGGVLELELRSHPQGEDEDPLLYLAPYRFRGPVVLEVLGVEAN